VGFRPRGLAVADGAVWVISHGRERIARVDAGTLRRTGPQPRIGRGAWSIAADGDAALWVAVPRRGAVLRLDPASGRVTGRIRPPLTPVDVRVGADGLWIAGRARRDVDPHPPDAVFRYDRAGHRVLRIPVPLEVSAIAPAGSGVWIAVNLERKLLHYDAAGRLRRQSQITEAAGDVTFGKGSAWGTVPSVDAVTEVPRGRPSVTTDIGVQPAELALAGGRVFVAGNTDHSVVVLDTDSGRPVGAPLPVGLNPMAVTAGAGHVWVAGMGDNSLTRIAY
jgi:DNA-binding beta-propeller fold protein YncE